ncbi:glycosyltransferase family 2 protein [Ruminococcus sp.]|uniref:glycosyltransferase family 2 protein n=1 Tax=Ruminococcus sp. TaxID=41978 RepID=UPI0026007B20|nr:glycosyltransferase family 2 protein [Ruminococcus sp.]
MKVCVIMSTYNGHKYLKEQIDSILNQDERDIHIFVRDDNSSDNTIEILESYQKTGKLSYVKGENLGVAKSFLKALSLSPDADYYAFADQDDIWDSNKISNAIKLINIEELSNPRLPIIYHSKVKIADSYGNVIGQNGKYTKKGFLGGECGNVIGCTIVFNKILFQEINKYFPTAIIMHDAWVHDVCLALDGIVVYDDIPHIKYRQHDENQVGGRRGIISSIKRRIKYYKKRQPNINQKMLMQIIEGYGSQMNPQYVKRARKICSYKDSLKNSFDIIFDKSFFQGRPLWRLERIILILLRKY